MPLSRQEQALHPQSIADEKAERSSALSWHLRRGNASNSLRPRCPSKNLTNTNRLHEGGAFSSFQLRNIRSSVLFAMRATARVPGLGGALCLRAESQKELDDLESRRGEESEEG